MSDPASAPLEGRTRLDAYIPQDRRAALAAGVELPDRTHGAALFADLSGFTSLTERLAATLGPLRGAEELSLVLRDVYGALIGEVERSGGSVIGFSGDAITCWFDGDDGHVAVNAAHGMQRCMADLGQRPLTGGGSANLRVKVAVAVGPVRRFAVGNPAIQRIDVIAGTTLDSLAAAEHAADAGDIVLAMDGAPGDIEIAEIRRSPEGAALGRVAPRAAAAPVADPVVELGDDAAEPWVLPTVRRRLRHALGTFLAGFRPAAALFLSFRGIDYDADPDAGAKLDAFVAWAQRIVDDHGGTLVQLTIGDKGSYLYAAFGAPVAHDDDPARAVSAARTLLAPPQPYVRQIRIGLTHGQMFTGNYGSAGRCTYGVLGPMTNLSARLMGKADEGGVLCSREIARQAARRWRFEERPAIRVKGVADPVPVFVPLGEAAGARAAATPLVGRDDELGRLRASLRAARRGALATAVVEGEPGQGKTRLLDAVADEAEAAGMAVLRGAGRSLGQDATYRAWRDVVQDALGLRSERLEVRTVTSALEGLDASLTDHLAALDDVLAVGVQPRMVAEGSERRQLVAAAVAAVLSARARRAPLALLLDDAHALDSLSAELLDEVALRLERDGVGAAIVLGRRLGEGRDAGLSAAPDRIVLAPLSEAAVERLAAARLALDPVALPPGLRSLLRDRAGGNPLVAEGLVDHLRNEGALHLAADGSGSCVLDETNAVLAAVPQTLRGLLLSSIDRLGPESQLTLKAAAVVGREFATPPLTDALVGVAQLDESAALGHVRGLSGDGFVDPLPAPESYRFRQALTHEVAYETLLFAQRRRFHGRLAHWWHTSGGQDPGPFAYHAYHAAEGSDDPDVVAMAADAQIAEALHLLGLGAYPEAAVVVRRGLGLLEDAPRWHPRRATLLVYLGTVEQHLSAYDDAAAHLQQALDLARRASENVTVADALNGLCMVATRQGSFDDAERYARAGLDHSARTGDRASEGRARSRLGILAAYRGDFAEASEQYTAAIRLAEETGDDVSLASCVSNLGLVRVYQQQYAVARPLFERALRVADALRSQHLRARFVTNLGLVEEHLDDLDAAEAHYREGLAIFDQLGARQEAASNAASLGDVAVRRGRLDAARGAYRHGLAAALGLGALPIALYAIVGLAWVAVREGDAARAAELLATASNHPATDAEVEQHAGRVMAEVRAALGEPAILAATQRGRATTVEVVARSEGVEGA